jgi:pyruvate formate lyase activating enzyme
LVYTRVMGYHRPVESFNIGKKGEHKQRVHFRENPVLAKPICNITPFTLLDYPNKSACILWYAGCNMRCLYCYNPEIVLGKGAITFSETISFLKKRKGLLDAVVFSGGECLIHKNIVEQIKEVKALGFLVKIDTNGSNSKVVKQLTHMII